MNIRFIDTSVLLNILNVPNRNQNHMEVMQSRCYIRRNFILCIEYEE